MKPVLSRTALPGIGGCPLRVSVNLTSGGAPDVDLVVPPGHVYVVGDHRGNSVDSRMFGMAPEQSVYARALGVFWRSGEGPVWRALN